MSTRTIPLPADTIIHNLQQFDGRARGIWENQVIVVPFGDDMRRVGLRKTPRLGLRYHLVILRFEMHRVSDDETSIRGKIQIEPWVWFAVLPLFTLLMYSLALMASGDLSITPYTIAMNLKLAAYSTFMVGLLLTQIRELRRMFRAATQVQATTGDNPPPA